MDEATLFNKFSKRVDYSKSNTKGKIPCETGVVWATWLLFEILNPFNISGMDEATLLKLRKCIDYGECHTRG